LRDVLNNSAAKIEMERQQWPTEPNAKIHAAWNHEQATRRDKATALAVSDASMDSDRSIKMENYHLIIDGFEGIFERQLSLHRRI
jgi:hypothetical protein